MADELVELLQPAFPEHDIASVSRRPYRYATSFALEEVRLGFTDGGEQTVILKDLSWERLLDGARRSKPPFLYEPRREIETHLRLLAPRGIGPRCFGAVSDPSAPRHWLLLEKVAGVELWQVGDLGVWEGVARWLASFHARFAGRMAEVRAANPFLLEHDAGWFRMWHERAVAALAHSDDARAAVLTAALDPYDSVVEALAAMPATFAHGEFYPSNIIVSGSGSNLRVCPIDWEMAATGPVLVDLAALTGGWDDDARQRLVTAYRAASSPPSSSFTDTDLDRCRLHLALQWLGWSPEWQPPVEHGHDWLGEALEMVERIS